MYQYGQLSILGINPGEVDEDVYTLLVSEEVFSRLESYKELVDRRAEAKMTPERAYSLIFNITEGSHDKKLEAASQAAIEVTPVTDNSFE